MVALSASQVNRAGKVLRDWYSDAGRPVMGPAERAALDVLVEFRGTHATPLLKANNGLRSMLRTEGCPVEVSQRLKRMSTIIDKLTREPTMALSRMQDIGGCRAIVNTLDQLRRVERRLAKNRPPERVDDYVAHPRSSGYRAVHLIIQYDGRRIEVQLRTMVMHEWAVAVERLGGQLGQDLKSGRGPLPVLDWLEAISEALAIEEQGGSVDGMLIARLAQLRLGASPYLSGGSR